MGVKISYTNLVSYGGERTECRSRTKVPTVRFVFLHAGWQFKSFTGGKDTGTGWAQVL